MPLKHCLILPHGFSLIEEISGDEHDLFKDAREKIKNVVTSNSIKECSNWLVITPHGARVANRIFLYENEKYKTVLEQKGFTYTRTYKKSEVISDALNDKDFDGLIENLIYGTPSGTYGIGPLDWGASIPLYFLEDHVNISVIAIDRYAPNAPKLVNFGQMLFDALDQLDEEVGIILSSDLGHCHTADGVGGYHPASKVLDESLMRVLKFMDFSIYDNIDHEIIDNGKSDAIGQIQILRGILSNQMYELVDAAYYVPTYFGLPIAYYRRIYG